MRLRILPLAPLLLATTLATTLPSLASPSPAPRFPQHQSDLAPDPAVRFGTLENGLRYAILPNSEPRGRASLRLVILAGSLHEEEHERGLAHFLEHMAFNGSTHFAPGELIKYFQRIGMGFGNDTNAYVTFDHTAYLLELPGTDGPMLDEGLRVLSDYAGGLLFDPGEIERERGVILAEKRDSNTPDSRTFAAEIDFLLPGSRLSQRMPIGLESVIQSARQQDFRTFHDTWYRPDRMLVVAVGDFNPDDIEPRIANHFNPLSARAPDRAPPAPGPVVLREPVTGYHTRIHIEADAPAATVSISSVLPLEPAADTSESRRRSLVREIAHDLLSRRLQRLSEKENAPFTSSYAAASEFFHTALISAVELTGPADRWKEALTIAEQEVRRALRYGFDASELATAIAARRNALEEAVRTAPTRRSPQLAVALSRGFVANRVFTHPQTDLDLLGPVLDSLTPAEVHESLKADWSSPQGLLVFVCGNLGETSQNELSTALAESLATEVLPPEQRGTLEFAYTDFGSAGTVLADEQTAHDIRKITFSNGVLLNLKHTDFEAGKIRFIARVGYGRLLEPADQPGLALLTDLAFLNGALGRHSRDDLRQLLAGRTASLSFSTAEDAFVFSGQASPRDLHLALQLFAAHLSDPGFRTEAFSQAASQLTQIYNQLESEPSGMFQLHFARAMTGDPRFGLPSREEAAARTRQEVIAWLRPALASAPIELSVIGDLDPDAVIKAVASTLAALPPREERSPMQEARQLKEHAGAPDQTLSRTTTGQPKALVAVGWLGADRWDISLTRRLSVLADMLGNRVLFKVREELGDAYSPYAMNFSSEAYPGLGWISAVVECSPDQADSIAATIVSVAADMAAGNISDDERIRSVRPALTGIIDNFRNNAYWLNLVMNGSREHPERLTWPDTLRSDFENMTTAELNQLASRHLAQPALVWKVRFDNQTTRQAPSEP